jgi:hypothetical protein
MKYKIIEDCSPYYIRFTFDKLNDIIEYVRNNIEHSLVNLNYQGSYFHCNFEPTVAETIISMLPMSTQMSFIKDRVAIFDTKPYTGCGIHKDGINCKISLNLTIEVNDNLCITNWYDDETFANSPIMGLPYTRNVHMDVNSMNQFSAIKTMTAVPDEMILFNTDIYHSWDNTNSPNRRKILTLRINDNYVFDDARKILFNY